MACPTVNILTTPVVTEAPNTRGMASADLTGTTFTPIANCSTNISTVNYVAAEVYLTVTGADAICNLTIGYTRDGVVQPSMGITDIYVFVGTSMNHFYVTPITPIKYISGTYAITNVTIGFIRNQ